MTHINIMNDNTKIKTNYLIENLIKCGKQYNIVNNIKFIIKQFKLISVEIEIINHFQTYQFNIDRAG